MVIGHSGCPILVHNYVYTFQVALFFMASGYCLKDKVINDLPIYCKKKLIGLWIPYIKWGIVFVLLHNLFYELHLYDSLYGLMHIKYSLHDIVANIVRTTLFLQNEEPLLGGYWFIRELLFGSILSVILIRYLCNTKIVLLTLWTLAMILVWTKWKIPYFNLGFLTIYASLYFVSGYFTSQTKLPTIPFWKNICLFFFIVCVSYFFPHPGVAETTKKTFAFYYPLSLVSVYVVWNFSQYIALRNPRHVLCRFLSFIGRNTLIILTLHFLAFKFVSWLIVWVYDLDVRHIADFPIIESYANCGWWFLYSIIGLALPIGYKIARNKLRDIICIH